MYPYLSFQIYYGSNECFSRINIEKRTYELRILYHSSESVYTVIPVSDTNLIVRQHTDNARYYEQSNKRYIDARYIGDFNLELLYPHPTEDRYISLLDTITVYQSGDFPRLSISYYLDDNKQLNFLDMANGRYEVKVFLNFSETDSIQIPIQDNDTALRVRAFDRNVFLNVESNKLYVNLTEAGSARLTAYFDYCGESFVTNSELLVYTTFFKDRYRDFLVQEQDQTLFDKNVRLRVLFNSMMEFLDILYAYYHDIQQFDNILKIKDKFLDVLSISRGMIRNNLYDGQYLESVYNQLYRELLMNLVDLIGLRGTKLSYELFFGALGYDIDLLEYWFDAEGNLVEVNYDNPDESTFYGYYADGTPIGEQLTAQPDPRRNVSASNPYNQNNKSKYIRPVITPKSDRYNPLAYTAQQQILVRQYLQMLKPLHAEYLYEVIIYNLTFQDNDYLIGLLDDIGRFNVAFFVIVLGDYIDPYDVQTPMTPLPEPPYNQNNWVYWVPPPALPDNFEYNYQGPWDWQARGMCIEHLKGLNDLFSLGSVNTWVESIDFPIRYDDVYEYDGAEPDSVGLRYDKGIVLYDVWFTINMVNFRTSYITYQQQYGTDEEAIIAALMEDYSITEATCELILSLVE